MNMNLDANYDVMLSANDKACVSSTVKACGAVVAGLNKSHVRVMNMMNIALKHEPDSRGAVFKAIKKSFLSEVKSQFPAAWTENDNGQLAWSSDWATICGTRLSEMATLVRWSVNHTVNIPETLGELQREYKRIKALENAAKGKNSNKNSGGDESDAGAVKGKGKKAREYATDGIVAQIRAYEESHSASEVSALIAKLTLAMNPVPAKSTGKSARRGVALGN